MKKPAIILLFILLTSASYGQQAKSIEDSLQQYFFEKKENLDPIEGLWDVFTVQEDYHYDTLFNVKKAPKPVRVSISRNGDKFESQLMSGEPFNVEFSTTDVKRVYLFRNFFSSTNQFSKPHAVLYVSGDMEYTYDLPKDTSGGKQNEGDRTVKILTWKKTAPLNK